LGVASNIVDTAGPIISKLSGVVGSLAVESKDSKTALSDDPNEALKMALYEIAITKSFCSAANKQHDNPPDPNFPIPSPSDVQQMAIIYTLLQVIDNSLSWANLQMKYDKSGHQVIDVNPSFYNAMAYVREARIKMFGLMCTNTKTFPICTAPPANSALRNYKIVGFNWDSSLDDQWSGVAYNNKSWFPDSLYLQFVPESDTVKKLFKLVSSVNLSEVKDTVFKFPELAMISVENLNPSSNYLGVSYYLCDSKNTQGLATAQNYIARACGMTISCGSSMDPDNKTVMLVVAIPQLGFSWNVTVGTGGQNNASQNFWLRANTDSTFRFIYQTVTRDNQLIDNGGSNESAKRT